MIKLKGKLVYNPVRPGFNKDKKRLKTLVLELNPGFLNRYYSWFLKQEHGPWMDLAHPMYGYHVTVISWKERVGNHVDWFKFVGEQVTIEYDPTSLAEKFGFWYVNVKSDRLIQIREAYGLPPKHDVMHMTIGRDLNQIRAKKIVSIQEADKIISMIPDRNGNQNLRDELKILRTQRRLADFIHTVRQHITDPNEGKPWERDIINLIRREA